MFMFPLIPHKKVNGQVDRFGFTIIELLLGLAIAAIIGVGVYNIFWSSVKLDDRMRRIHDTYMEVLLADQILTHDLENAVSLDFSNSYPTVQVFEGKKEEMVFLTKTPTGIKRVRYYAGLWDNAAAKVMIGRVVNPSTQTSKEDIPIEFLLRQEGNLADWLNETSNHTSVQIIAAGLKKESFQCQYATFIKDLRKSGINGLNYQDSWTDKALPLGVSCSFVLYDPAHPQGGLKFKRDIFLSVRPHES